MSFPNEISFKTSREMNRLSDICDIKHIKISSECSKIIRKAVKMVKDAGRKCVCKKCR